MTRTGYKRSVMLRPLKVTLAMVLHMFIRPMILRSLAVKTRFFPSALYKKSFRFEEDRL